MATKAVQAAGRYSFGLKPRDPLIGLAHRILTVEFQTLRESLPHSASQPRPEQIHEMRIATRRLRVALRLFSGFVGEQAAAFRRQYQWLGRALGELRDLDVYAGRVAADTQALGPEAAQTAARLRRSIDGARNRARRRLKRTLQTQRFRQLVESFGEYLEQEPAPTLVRRWRSLTIADAAHEDLARTTRRVVKLGRKIDKKSSARALHRLRIKVKRLRYEVEFYAGFYPSLRRLARGAKDLQDFLGLHQDACIAAERLGAYAEGLDAGDDAEMRAISSLIAAEARKADDLRHGFARNWRRFEKRVAASKLSKKSRK